MRMARRGGAEWVLKRITYFDHETHRFRIADIEIDGEWITAVRPPGASTIEYAVDGRAYACTPGLIHARSDLQAVLCQSSHLLESGITTAGVICATAGECIHAATHSPIRLIAHLLLNAFSGARVPQRNYVGDAHAAEVRFFEQIAALVSRISGHLMPAMHCPSIVSAQELVYGQKMAAALRRKLGFVLSDSASAAQIFGDRFYCSETQLLEFMQLLQPGTSIWGLSQLTRIDVEILRRSGAEVLGLSDLNMRIFRQPCAHATPTTNFGALFGDCDLNADAAVDAATVSAAAALGDTTCGQIAPGMRADLCLFATSTRELGGLGSAAFIDFFGRSRPRLVLIGARKAYESPSAIISSNSLLPPYWIRSPAPDISARL